MAETCKFVLDGLDCANCALKIEDNVKSMEGVNNATVNFTNKTMTIESDASKDVIFKRVEGLIKDIEPDVTIRDKEEISKRDHLDPEGNLLKEGLRLILGLIPFILALTLELSPAGELTLFATSYIIIGSEVLKKAFRNIARGQIFDENFLMAIATLGAFAIGEYPEGVAVLLFYEIGELFQDMAVNRSRKSIADLMDIRPDYANLKEGDNITKVDPEDIVPGDIIVVRPGEKVPLDGNIIDGESTMDTSALTGESMPRKVEVGDEVLGGFINNSGLLYVRVTKPFGQSTASKILDLVENAGSKKAQTERFITRFARGYTPVVVFSAMAIAVLPPILVSGARFSDWFYRALVFLVISCPCALVISIPLGFFGGIGGASKKGVLVKGGNYLEALAQMDTVIFDKTGTLTKGQFAVVEINPASGVDEEELLYYAAAAESHSNHPIAPAIKKAYHGQEDKAEISDYREIPGHGIAVRVDGDMVLAGNGSLMDMEGIVYDETHTIGTIVYIAREGVYMGSLVVADEVKKDSYDAIKGLRKQGIGTIAMLTGDTKEVGEKVAQELGLDMVYPELLPHEKVEKLEELEKNLGKKGKLAFVGDGINDAPVLARADIGIAMGGLGSDAAIEAADVVLMTDEPHKLVDAIDISRKTNRIVRQNIILALGVKGIVLLMGAFGVATMWEAVFADVGVALIAVFNSMRAARLKD